MEDFPEEYTQHNLPLVLLSGLGLGDDVQQDPSAKQSSGTKLLLNTPECEGERAHQLLDQFVKRDGTPSAWNAGTLPGPVGSIKYCMRPIGRVGMPVYWV